MKHCCPWWLAYTFDNRLRRRFQDPDAMLAPHVRPGMVALDVGCGMGFFSIAMARLVGPAGKVISVDLQERMLQVLESRARKAGVFERISPTLAARDDLRVGEPVDFALTMWMMHEVPDQGRMLGQIFGLLKPGARLLLVEPKLHVSERAFEATVALALETGFELAQRPSVGLSYAALLGRP